MGLKFGQNINFRPFFRFLQRFWSQHCFLGHNKVSWSRQFFRLDTVFWGCDSVLVATQFFGVATVFGQRPVFLLQLVDAITSSF